MTTTGVPTLFELEDELELLDVKLLFSSSPFFFSFSFSFSFSFFFAFFAFCVTGLEDELVVGGVGSSDSDSSEFDVELLDVKLLKLLEFELLEDEEEDGEYDQ
ncbi:hypothetical protein AGMMS49950_09360 [Endomicrobiia bacterium]|nr:hypothetical protein AGMMS49950_09360 [Endomicrobiia bacterium]